MHRILALLFASILAGALGIDFNQKYNVPTDAKGVLIFGQSSHLDWDWLNWFPTNVNNIPPSTIPYWGGNVQPTDVIFAKATDYLLANESYGYSVSDMSFLQRFSVDNPSQWTKMKNSGKLYIVGGGVTSPDSLLPHGEAFIRNYLVGISWLRSENITWNGTVWLPDDFGHDSQLPVVLSAMGVKAASFSRVPGSCHQGLDSVPPGVTSAHKILLNEDFGGLDFWWQANDGSRVFIYYQPNHYACGDGIISSRKEPTTPQQQSQCASSPVNNPTERISAYIGVRSPLKKTPYMFVATGSDFALPVPGLVSVLNQWNSDEYPKNGIFAVAASFEDYAELVLDYVNTNGIILNQRNFHGTAPSTSFKPTPYWMGFYSSRVGLKQFHYETVKALIGAEVFISIVQKTEIPAHVKYEQIKNMWNLTVPSVHHDFVTGTATDYVVIGEQNPLMESVYASSTQIKNILIDDITNSISGPNSQEAVFVTFNQLGFARSGIATIPVNGVSEKEISQLPYIQKTASGEYISIFRAPSFGYSSVLVTETPTFGALRVYSYNDSFVLENSFLTATVSKNMNWAVTSLIEKATGRNVIQVANLLQFRNDNGDIYRFGYEEGCGFNDYQPQITALSGSVIESGPVRCTVQTSITVSTSSWTRTYILSYSLVASEPFLRISINGSAPSYTTVLTQIKYLGDSNFIETYEHGTPYHWDYKEPFPYGSQSDFRVTFEATHDYILSKDSSGAILGAVYHNSTPAWGVSEDKSTLYGVLLRNSPSGCAGKGAAGTDSSSHYVSYALRIPSNLSSSNSGQPLKEARAFHTPLTTRYVPGAVYISLPATFSLATVVSPPSAIITVGKPGEYDGNSIFFRVYCPDNIPNQVSIALAYVFSEKKHDAIISTALEEVTTETPVTWGANNTISFKQVSSLITVKLQPKN